MNPLASYSSRYFLTASSSCALIDRQLRANGGTAPSTKWKKKKYGSVVDPRSSFYLRHRMVLSFLWLQQKRDQFPGKNQRELGYITAHSFKRGCKTAKLIVKWTKSWIRDEEILNTNRGRNKHNFSWMDDEDVVFVARGFCRK